VLAAGALASGCGRSTSTSVTAKRSTLAPITPHNPARPALGLTEDNANLLWPPASASASGASGDESLAAARRELTALHPRYVRLLVDWAALQPDAAHPPNLELPTSGCARTVGPCAPYAGLRAEFEALGAQQRAARSGAAPGFEVVLDVFGTPEWAAAPASGCELPHSGAFSRPLRATAIAGYRALIRSLLALGAREGVQLSWWSPWNEPNDSVFISPQRASCDARSAPLSPGVYAQLATAMSEELSADSAGEHHLLLGELNAYERDSPHSTSISSFIASLPASVICLSGTWSIHAYAARGPAAPSLDPVKAIETALDGAGGCGRSAHVWVTEAGAGASHPGRRRPPGEADQRAGCTTLAGQLRDWSEDPRVDAVLQYSFREDPAFPVGLLSADLSHTYPAYRVWSSYARARTRGAQVPAPAILCA